MNFLHKFNKTRIIRSKIAWIVLIITMLSLLGSCGVHKKGNFADEYQSYGNMLVLGLVNDTDLTENGVVYLNAISDNLNVQFANLTDKDSEYILKLFLDYKEIQFHMNGDLVNSYIFQAEAGDSYVFPVNIDSTIELSNSHILTVAVLTAPQKHAKAVDFMSNSYGVVLSYELAPKIGKREIIRSDTFDEPLAYLELNYQGLMLNSDFEGADNTIVQFPSKDYIAAPGDKIELAYRAGNYDNAEDILIVVLVDWQQQSINGADYIYIRNIPGYISYGTLEFTAPAEAGEYEVTAFVVDQPFELKDSDSFHTHDTAYRFTLTVQE